MFDERKFIARVERADVSQLAELLRRPNREEEAALRVYFGDDAYRRMHSLAFQGSESRRAPVRQGNVVVLHGIMGGELTRIPPGASAIRVWVNLWRLAIGEFACCRLTNDGVGGEHDIRAGGILKRYYGEMLLSLAQSWNVRPFWYDWRKDIRWLASSLESYLQEWFDEREAVHLVAHSMGGLVARAFVRKYRKRWKRMASAGSQIIMLGTPNFGSFVIPQVLTGTEPLLRKVAMLDLRHDWREVRGIASTFPSCYQMLPSPDIMPSMKRLYEAEAWEHLPNVSRRHLDRARETHRWLYEALDRETMCYIAGCNQPTADNIEDFETFRQADYGRVSNTELYHFSIHGDGTVPHQLGFLSEEGQPIFDRIYFSEEEHGSLPSNREVIQAVHEILRDRDTQILPKSPPSLRGVPDQDQLKKQWVKTRESDTHVDRLLKRMSTRSCSIDEPEAVPFSSDERSLEAQVMRSFLYVGESGSRGPALGRSGETPSIEIGLVHGSVSDVDCEVTLSNAGHRVDCISVGHYIGVKPAYAEAALDRAISGALLGKNASDSPRESDLILTKFTERGILRGELGHPFLMVDPRCDAAQHERLIAVAGMGLPGQFGLPELTVLARELCWTLGELGKRHLLTVLIGSGTGNLSPRDAILGWLRGIAQTLRGAARQPDRRLDRVTFVELDARRLRSLKQAIESVGDELATTMVVNYCGLGEEDIDRHYDEARDRQMQVFDRQWRQGEATTDLLPMRVMVQMAGSTYRFGAITSDASIPERSINLDPRLVESVNDKLAAATEPQEQREWGAFLERLLIPRDLRTQLSSSAPLVMVLDRTTAKIHWEMLAQPDPLSSTETRRHTDFDETKHLDSFLATARGFTRQFRTVLGPPPEPPPPPRHVLRVLVVVDPAEDAKLPGAEQEGIEVADLFESFNTLFAQKSNHRVEVERLFGPFEATRENVLKRLTLEPWDVLHFAGHCYFNAEDPTASGWIFGMKDKRILSANELNRIDHIPRFVFSNACESGVTPDCTERRDARLAPSFAEAFFQRGVANFVCTAWPIDDSAGRAFANKLYTALLGLNEPDNPEPAPMYRAMRDARRELARHGGRTWGAYQHYGDPNFRLFNPDTFLAE